MNFYESNIEIIRENRIKLYEGLESYDKGKKEGIIDSVNIIEAKDSNLILNIEKGTKKYRLNSIYRPVEEAEKWVEQYNFNNFYKVISLFGLGNGMFAQQIIKKMNKDDILLIYEPSVDIFIKVLENIDLKEILENMHVILVVEGLNEKQFADVIRDSVEWLNLYSQIICCCPQYELIFRENYRDFLRIIRDNNSRALVNQSTEAFLGKSNSCNVVKNLKYLVESSMATDLKKYITADMSAIIVAAGPSLDKNIQQLKNAKGKSIIIATDTAINSLLAHDIIPDFTITLDPIKPTKCYQDERANSIPIFYQMPSNNDIISKHKGRKFIYNHNIYVSKLLKDFNKKALFNATGGSVATAAFSVCISLGIKRIIMVGQDLAFSGRNTHVGGVQASEQQINQQMVMVEDINGDMVPTPWNFYTFLMWFNDAVELCKDVDVIDATEGGAKINGTTIMTLREAIDMCCVKSFDLKTIIESLEPTFNSNEIKKLNVYLKQSISDLDLIIKKSIQIIKYAEMLIGLEHVEIRNQVKSNSIIQKISKEEKWIEKRMVYHLLEPYVAKELSTALNQITRIDAQKEERNDKKEFIAVYQKVIDVYDALIKGSTEMKPLLQEAILYYE